MRKRHIRWFSDTLPHLITLALGTLVMGLVHWTLAPIYLVISFLGIIWFMTHICPYCYAYGSYACPSGYGLISARMVNRRQGSFRKAFLRNIWSVAIEWFLPLIAGVVSLFLSFDPMLLFALLVFFLFSFVLLPLTARRKGCSTCPQKKECPWQGK